MLIYAEAVPKLVGSWYEVYSNFKQPPDIKFGGSYLRIVSYKAIPDRRILFAARYSKPFSRQDVFMNMEHNNKEVLTKANALVSAGDNEGFLAFCTDDIIWDFVGDQRLEGKEAIRKYMDETYVSPPKFDIESIFSEGDRVGATGKISLADESGKMVTYDYCDLWHFRDGKMDHLKAFVISPTENNEE